MPQGVHNFFPFYLNTIWAGGERKSLFKGLNFKLTISPKRLFKPLDIETPRLVKAWEQQSHGLCKIEYELLFPLCVCTCVYIMDSSLKEYIRDYHQVK